MEPHLLTFKMLTLGIVQTSLTLLSLNRIFAPSNQQNIYSKIKNYYLITLMTDLG